MWPGPTTPGDPAQPSTASYFGAARVAADIERWRRNLRSRFSAQSQARPRIRVSVTYGFWLLAVLATCSGSKPQPLLIAVLLSVLLARELPCALLTRRAGRSARVTIDGWGGKTEVEGAPLPLPLALDVTIIGSASNVSLGLLLLAVERSITPGWATASLVQAAHLHLLWGVVQLTPVPPFKVGLVLERLLGLRLRLMLAAASLVLALGMVVTDAAELASPLVCVGLSVWLAGCFRALHGTITTWLDQRIDVARIVGDVEALTLAGKSNQAVALAQQALASARSAELRARAWKALAWAAIGESNQFLTHTALRELPIESIDLYLLAAYLSTSGSLDVAIEVLEDARKHGVRSAETAKLLADSYFRRHELDRVAMLAAADRNLLSPEDCARIQQALDESRSAGSARLVHPHLG
jgi:hypothetical protein